MSVYDGVSILSQSFDSIPLLGLFILFCCLCGVSVELGYRVGRWRHIHFSKERDQTVGAMVGAILGLVALVLAFTFNLAASRFDTRRQTIVEEANAIGTTALRARFLPEPERSKISELLREYVKNRIRGRDALQIQAEIRRSEELHEELWTQAVAAEQHSSHPVTTGLFIQSLNEVIDLHSKRVFVGLRNRIPFIIWAGLSGLAVLGITAVGYQSGLSATERSPMMFGLILAFVFVMYLIADLDRSSEGFLQVGEDAMFDLQKNLRSTADENVQ